MYEFYKTKLFESIKLIKIIRALFIHAVLVFAFDSCLFLEAQKLKLVKI